MSILPPTPAPTKRRKAIPNVNWGEYPRLTPGEYSAYCKWAEWYWEPGYQRWTCLIHWEILVAGGECALATVPQWFNGGNGKKPRAGRRANYFAEWVKANGGPPARKDRLSSRVFVRRIAKVELGDTGGLVPYSVVRRVVAWSTGTPVNKSHIKENMAKEH